MRQPLYLTQAEIDGICEPLVAPAAQIRYLRRLGMKVEAKPNRRALVARAEFERVMGGETVAVPASQSPATADVIALRQRWAAKGKRHGAQTQGR